VVPDLRAIDNPHRRDSLGVVRDEQRSSGEVASHFIIIWPAISQNLRVLEGAGLLSTRRRGTTRLYRANHEILGPLKEVLVQMWAADLTRLAVLAEADRA